MGDLRPAIFAAGKLSGVGRPAPRRRRSPRWGSAREFALVVPAGQGRSARPAAHNVGTRRRIRAFPLYSQFHRIQEHAKLGSHGRGEAANGSKAEEQWATARRGASTLSGARAARRHLGESQKDVGGTRGAPTHFEYQVETAYGARGWGARGSFVITIRLLRDAAERFAPKGVPACSACAGLGVLRYRTMGRSFEARTPED